MTFPRCPRCRSVTIYRVPSLLFPAGLFCVSCRHMWKPRKKPRKKP